MDLLPGGYEGGRADPLLIRQDAAGAHVAHHEVGGGGALDFHAVGGGCVDEAEHAMVQVHVHDDAHVADAADAAPGAEEDEVALAEVGEAFHRPAVLGLQHGVVRQFVAEFPVHVAPAGCAWPAARSCAAVRSRIPGTRSW